MEKDCTNPEHPDTHQLNNPYQPRILQLHRTAELDKNTAHP